MTPEDRQNERFKLGANWFNALAVAVVSVGAFVPLAQEIYGFLPATTDPSLVYGVTPVCVAAGLFLHLAGQWLLGGLE